ncbi:MAG: hypothetical protein DDT19_01469 [Syntrophomonadaceae bacterium]|nr:hypothetical protein [Bacillota bacterium]
MSIISNSGINSILKKFKRDKMKNLADKKEIKRHNPSMSYSLIKDHKTKKWIGKLRINGLKYKIIGDTRQEVHNWIKIRIQKQEFPYSLVSKREQIKNPPLKNMVKIYDNILSIEAEKGKDSLWPNDKFRHDFKSSKGKAKIYGLSDGSLLIKGNKKLWGNFNYK